jgi:D-alanine-D-alanine ligase
MQKKTVAVLFGGASSEHAVSRMSAASVLQHIPTDRYDVITIGITQDGRWLLYSGSYDEIPDGSWENHPENRTAFFAPDQSVKGLVIKDGDSFTVRPVDVVFPVLHGKNGEDGTLQGLLQMNGIPFVGCDLLSSAACMDKGVTNILLEAAGVPKAKFLWLYAMDYEAKRDAIRQEIAARLGGYPVYVKPANAGSSVGVSKVHDESELDNAIAVAGKEDGKIVIEEAIVGQEVECAVLGNECPKASVVGEICTDADFYDYEDKYINGTSQTLIPAHIPEETAEEIRKIAVHAYRSLGCGGLSRVDFFVRSSDGAIFLNELNTLPGFTSISMYPKLWEATGLPYEELLDTLIQLSFQRK